MRDEFISAGFSGFAKPTPTDVPETPVPISVMSVATHYTAGKGLNRVTVPKHGTIPHLTNNSAIVASVSESHEGIPGVGSAVLQVYNVAAGFPNIGQAT